jgi:hypothetical protein
MPLTRSFDFILGSVFLLTSLSAPACPVTSSCMQRTVVQSLVLAEYRNGPSFTCTTHRFSFARCSFVEPLDKCAVSSGWVCACCSLRVLSQARTPRSRSRSSRTRCNKGTMQFIEFSRQSAPGRHYADGQQLRPNGRFVGRGRDSVREVLRSSKCPPVRALACHRVLAASLQWCSHCTKLAPTFAKAATAMAPRKAGRIDCVEHKRAMFCA